MSNEILRVNNLKKEFGTRGVLHDINFSINRGEVVSILGSSGSGKSTLLRCINLLEIPTDGDILFHGKSIMSGALKKEEYRQKVGMVFQSFNLFNNLNVLENCVLAPMKTLGISREEAVKRANKYLDKVGMAGYVNARPKQLSGGQKQRVAIARALCMEPEILLFDEPTSALDPEMVQEVLRAMNTLAEEGMTMAVVTHEMNFAKNVSNRIVFLDEGVITVDTDSKNFFENPENEKVKSFLSHLG